MIIQIDVRETELIKSCTFLISSMPCFKDLQLEITTLPIGDIIICDDIPSETSNEKTHTEYVIIERKSLKDLCASIKDGRYEEQSYRLNGLPHHNHNIVYLIEGSMDKINMFKGIQEKIILYSAMVSINYFKGFSLWRSQHIEESALIVCNAAYKIAKGLREQKCAHYKYVAPTVAKSAPELAPVIVVEETPIAPPSETPSPTIPAPNNEELLETAANEKQYCSVVKKVKKENITVNNIGEIILCQIPGVSTVTALAVLSAFKTLPMLIASIQKDQTCLNNVTYVTTTGQTRKISKACIENIIKYLGQ